MIDPYETLEHNGFTINIHQDTDPTSPSDWENDALFLVGFNDRHFTVHNKSMDITCAADVEAYMTWDGEIPEEPIHATDCERCEAKADEREAYEEWKSSHIPGYEVFPLQAYIHGGVALSLGAFSCPWDSGQVGYVLIKLSDVGEGKARECAERLVETWNQYLSGDVWGFSITDSDGEEVESCWGIYGLEDCIEDAKERCPEASETKERKVRILAKDGTWVEATMTVPLSMGDSQVPDYVMARFVCAAATDSVILAGATA